MRPRLLRLRRTHGHPARGGTTFVKLPHDSHARCCSTPAWPPSHHKPASQPWLLNVTCTAAGALRFHATAGGKHASAKLTRVATPQSQAARKRTGLGLPVLARSAAKRVLLSGARGAPGSHCALCQASQSLLAAGCGCSARSLEYKRAAATRELTRSGCQHTPARPPAAAACSAAAACAGTAARCAR